MNKVALLIGGNQGNRQALIEQATVLIQQRIGTVALASRIYETEPWGDFEIENPKLKIENFLNRALLVETELSAHEVLHEALAIEADLGRKRAGSGERRVENGEISECDSQSLHSPLSTLHSRLYRSRPMDIDLIFFWNADNPDDGGDIIDTPDLTIPHPRAHLRSFVLEPLSEIIPDYRHPTLNRTVRELLSSL